MSIQVNQLTKIYGLQHAVDEVSFEAKEGEILGFLGPNGAGKSTTMKMLTCYVPPTSGTALVCGYDILKNPIEVRQQIGYLPENNPLYLDMFVREYLEFVAHLHKLGKHTQQRVEEMIHTTGLTTEQHKKIGQLSKGYRQRVGLAQAMIHDPKVLILDEPTTGLDPNQLAEIRQLIKTLGEKKTVILSTHIMQEVQALCNRVLIINQGKIVANDTAEQLQQRTNQQTLLLVEFNQQVSTQKLEKIEHVTQATHLDGNKYHLITNSQHDARPKVFEFAVQNNLILLTLQRETSNLEDVFRQLTATASAV
ncbi:MAG: gliding motility-associated ABC transporter ATP-binding subunit GldA [Sphingobacteriales bacterium]|nr:gliding motility-associated ABC transporter ATP-binding subunit GldA [Sphingobacteriales bacterium]